MSSESETQLSGLLCYKGPSLKVLGLPKSNMLSKPNLVCKALNYFIKQTTGYEATHCEIVDGIGYLTFADPSGNEILNLDDVLIFVFTSSCPSNCG